jgi:hypothetical protein
VTHGVSLTSCRRRGIRYPQQPRRRPARRGSAETPHAHRPMTTVPPIDDMAIASRGCARRRNVAPSSHSKGRVHAREGIGAGHPAHPRSVAESRGWGRRRPRPLRRSAAAGARHPGCHDRTKPLSATSAFAVHRSGEGKTTAITRSPGQRRPGSSARDPGTGWGRTSHDQAIPRQQAQGSSRRDLALGGIGSRRAFGLWKVPHGYPSLRYPQQRF